MATPRHLIAIPTAADDMLRIFSAFDSPFYDRPIDSPTSTRSGTVVADLRPPSDADLRLSAAQTLILDSPSVSPDYLAAVDEIVAVVKAAADDELLRRGEDVLQTAMSRLEDEFRELMIRNTAALDNAEGLCGSMRSISFNSDAPEDDTLETDEQICRLIRPEAVSELKAIADRMIAGGYKQELCQVYSSVRREVLLECLSVLGADTVSIEEVQEMEWSLLDSKMKRWIQALRLVVRVILAEERRTCDLIFAESSELKEDCFSESAKVCVMHFLNFGDAIAIGQRSPEKLFKILGMYEALSEVLPDFESLFSGDTRDLICGEAEGVLQRLGQAVKDTLTEFGNAVRGEVSRRALQAGEIHPINRYVMNYLKLIVEFTGLLNTLLDDDEDDGQDTSEMGESMTPLAHRVLLLISNLEANLEEKAKLYDDVGMQYVSLMNNELYIVQKVTESELMKLLGDHWVRRRKGQIRKYGTSYLRASWAKVLSFLNAEGLNGSGSGHGGASRNVVKERFKNFNAAFEELYKTQTTWKIPDTQLRAELRVLISEMVLPAYRSFVGRFGGMLDCGWHGTRYVKYTVEDLEKSLDDFFEGLPATHSHSFLRRLSLS